MLWAGISAQSRGEVMYRIAMLRLRVATPRARICTSRARSWVARFQVGLLLAGLALVTNACVFDSGGVQGYWPSDQGVDHAPPKPDVAPDIAPDILAPDTRPPCSGLTCPLGCNTEEDRCYRMRPSNIDPEEDDVDYDEAVTPIILKPNPEDPEAPIVIDADRGEILGFTDSTVKAVREGISHVMLPQVDANGMSIPNAPEVAVFVFDALQITPGTVVRVVGTHPVIFYIRTTVEIGGTLLVNGSSTAPGPSGGAGGPDSGLPGDIHCPGSGEGGDRTSKDLSEWTSGGGGAGYGQPGATGAKVQCTLSLVWEPSELGGGDGGPVFGDETTIPLRGGCGGGAGGNSPLGLFGMGGQGGNGGGGLQISAGESVTITGIINASGAGGGGGQNGAAGGGGGSGGAILIEAPSVVVGGIIAANGGAGGAGSATSLTENIGANGADGQPSSVPASAGIAGLPYGTNGGNGGARATQPTPGENSAARCNGGGGGGGAGRIRINATKITPTTMPSPEPSPGKLLPYW
ncbi:MAG: hypothetical protein KAI47_22465 [Deltaproteobacteria bacterium]|nr:hypothetical protein [Deltaproteobacteria bacterium]